MKVGIISDTHLLLQNHINTDSGDVLIHCGDCLNHGSFKELPRFIEWFTQQRYKHKILVFGNHDFCLDHKDVMIRGSSLSMCADAGIHVLIDRKIEIDGVSFYGSPWQGSLPHWSAYKDRKERALLWKKIPEGLDFLITHIPPYGILDKAYKWTGDKYFYQTKEPTEHAGSKLLLKEIERARPKIACWGHIHESRGTTKKNGITFINAACLDRGYKPWPLPIITLDYNKKEKSCQRSF